MEFEHGHNLKVNLFKLGEKNSFSFVSLDDSVQRALSFVNPYLKMSTAFY